MVDMLGLWNNEGRIIVLYAFSLFLFRVMIAMLNVLMYIPNGTEFEGFVEPEHNIVINFFFFSEFLSITTCFELFY